MADSQGWLVASVLILLTFTVSPGSGWSQEELDLFDLVEEIGDNFYHLMQIEQDASNADIRRAYRQLSLQLHPDKSDDPDAAEKFRKMVAVADVLKDEELRQMYDQILIDGLPDWKQPLFYYRRMRKMGLLELSALLFLILSVAHYLYGWAVFVEKQIALQDLLDRKQKKDLKKSRNNRSLLTRQRLEAEVETLTAQAQASIPHLKDLLPVIVIKGTIWSLQLGWRTLAQRLEKWREGAEEREEEEGIKEGERGEGGRREGEGEEGRRRKEREVGEREGERQVEDEEVKMADEKDYEKNELHKISKTATSDNQTARTFYSVGVATETANSLENGQIEAFEEKLAAIIEESESIESESSSFQHHTPTTLNEECSQPDNGTIPEPQSSVSKGKLRKLKSVSKKEKKQARITVVGQEGQSSTLEAAPANKTDRAGAKSSSFTNYSRWANSSVRNTSASTDTNTASTITNESSDSGTASASTSPEPDTSTCFTGTKTTTVTGDTNSTELCVKPSSLSSDENMESTGIKSTGDAILDENDIAKTNGSAVGPTAQQSLWTQFQQKQLEWALARYPKFSEQRWLNIAKTVPGKTQEECVERCKQLHAELKQRRTAITQ